jgi:hypothetical protein
MQESKGILLFAHNNREIDYINFACVCAMFAKHYLNVPVSLVTNKGSLSWLKSKYPELYDLFDQFIMTDGVNSRTNQKRSYFDGSQNFKASVFNNGYRVLSYEFSPYEKTLVIDTDLLIMNDKLKNIWDTDTDFMINSNHFDLSRDRNKDEFIKVSDYSIDFYWATAFYFKKTKKTKIFFNLCKHILSNYDYYRYVYQIENSLIRNDYIFSIAIHILSGFANKIKPMALPCDIYYTLDKDELIEVRGKNNLLFLIQKNRSLGEYTLSKITDQNIHIMNKYSLQRLSDRLLKVINDV